MTEYIKIPTLPTQDLLRSVEAISPFPRITAKKPRQEGYSEQMADSDKERASQDTRRFLKLRSLIKELQKSAQINRVDFATADAEMNSLGLAIIEEKLIQQLLQLKIPLESIESLLQQMDNDPSSLRRVRDRQIESTETPLFPISTEGFSEYNLMIGDLKIHSGRFGQRIVDEIDQAGFSIHQQDRLRLTFSRFGSTFDAAKAFLKLQIDVLLGVVESDEADRRAILYPQKERCYGLYADKRISLSI